MPIFRTPKRGLSYSEAIAEAYASAPENSVILNTLEFRHPNFIDPDTGAIIAIRVVNDHVDLNATLEATAPANAGQTVLFKAVRFSFKRPSETDGASLPEITITVSNVARILIPYLDQAKESRTPIEVTYRPYLASDLTGPHMNPPLTLTLRSVNADMNNVTAQAGFGDLVNRRFPKTDYTAKKFPGLTAR
ncbi:MAG: DUF1833 family protein [Pseudomonadota bacterium]